MGRFYSFNTSVRGSSHIERGVPCEDASLSFAAPDGRYHIIAVADGHGDPACFRSDDGSKFAAEAALDCLKTFAEEILNYPDVQRERFFRDMFSDANGGRYRNFKMRELTDKVVDTWTERVKKDLDERPPAPEEISRFGTLYQSPNANMAHIYGSTLMAALWLRPEALFLIHQGDGRCDVFYADGSVNQPIPWDPLCEGNMTTSLCQEDAKERFRYCVLDLSQKSVTACYLGSDGVEDAYRDTYDDLGGSHALMGGVHTFYKRISREAVKRTKEELESYLAEKLPGFSANGLYSRTGSGDDVSVAGILFDVETLASYAKRFRWDCERYRLEEKLFWKENELGGKTRKRGVLKRRMDELAQEVERTQHIISMLHEQRRELMSEKEKQSALTAEAKRSWEEFQRDEQVVLNALGDISNTNFPVAEIMKSIRQILEKAFTYLKKELRSGRQQLATQYQEQSQRLQEKREELNEKEGMLDQARTSLNDVSQRFELAKNAYEEYERKCLAIETERDNIKAELDDLRKSKPPKPEPPKPELLRLEPLKPEPTPPEPEPMEKPDNTDVSDSKREETSAAKSTGADVSGVTPEETPEAESTDADVSGVTPEETPEAESTDADVSGVTPEETPEAESTDADVSGAAREETSAAESADAAP